MFSFSDFIVMFLKIVLTDMSALTYLRILLLQFGVNVYKYMCLAYV